MTYLTWLRYYETAIGRWWELNGITGRSDALTRVRVADPFETRIDKLYHDGDNLIYEIVRADDNPTAAVVSTGWKAMIDWEAQVGLPIHKKLGLELLL